MPLAAHVSKFPCAINLLTGLRAWWRGPATPPPNAFTDPLGYALRYCLHPPPGGLEALPGTWQATFPALTMAEAEAVQQLLALQELTTDLVADNYLWAA